MEKTQTLNTCRCAIYTRKSHELDAGQDFNTPAAQREADSLSMAVRISTQGGA